jgi:2-oxoisovalerate dehydrogenase E1 component
MPLDVETIVASVRKTHRLLVVDEGWAMCGIGAEIAQAINELAFDELDAPVGRLHPFATSHPFAPVLERAMLVDTPRIVQAARQVIAGTAPIPDHWRAPGLAAAIAPAAPAPAPAAAAKPAATRPPVAPDEVEITMPFGDLTVSEGRLVAWRKAVGDPVAEGELVAEIETDKAVVEIDSPAAGTLSAIEEEVGAMVPMGGRIGRVRKP